MNKFTFEALPSRSRWSRALHVSAVALLLAGPACHSDEGAPVDSKTIALTTQTNTEAVAKNLGVALSFMGDSDAMAETLGKLDPCPAVENCLVPGPDGKGLRCVVEPAPTDCGVEGARRSLKAMSADIDTSVADVVDAIKTKLLVEKNIESKTDTSITYKLPNDVLCDMTQDMACTMSDSKMEARVRVTSPREGDVDLAFLLTSSKTEVVVFHVYKDRLGVTVDLGNIYTAAKVIDKDGEFKDITRMQGVFALDLVRNSDKNYSALFEVQETIVVEGKDNGKTINVQLDASSKTWELRLDGVAKNIKAAVNLGALSIQAPLENLGDIVDSMPIMNNMKATDAMKFVLGGLNGSFTFEGKTDLLKFVGMGLGNKSTSVDVNGKRIFSLDVNPNSNRRFDLSVSMTDSKNPLFSFAPELESVFGFQFDSIKSRFSDLPDFLLNDTLTFKLGNNPSVRFLDKGVELVSGNMKLSSKAHPESNISVNPGMCLVEGATPSSTGHEFLSRFEAGSCQ
jgi:hypothetical protein